MPYSASHDGAAALRAEKHNREVDYPDVEASPHAQLLSLGCETYGRWSDQAISLIKQLARSKSNSAPQYLKKSMEICYFNRWWSLLSVGVQYIMVESITRLSGGGSIDSS